VLTGPSLPVPLLTSPIAPFRAYLVCPPAKAESPTQIAKALGIPRATVYRHLAE
jgi:hypothetical protein